MKTYYAILLLFSISLTSIHAQQALECDEAGEICDFDDLSGFEFTMGTDNSPGNQPNPLCPDGGAAHNITWLGFVAHEGNYSITITPSECSGSTTGVDGVQIGVYTDCTFSNPVICIADCSLNPLTISSDELVAGESYFLFVDGCSNSVCKIDIQLSGAFQGEYCDPLSIDGNGTTATESYEVNIFPNPASEYSQLQTSFEFDQIIVIQSDGKVVDQVSYESPKTEYLFTTEGWSKGVYYVNLRNQEKSKYTKLIVH